MQLVLHPNKVAVGPLGDVEGLSDLLHLGSVILEFVRDN
jgi:hypothetical protein